MSIGSSIARRPGLFGFAIATPLLLLVVLGVLSHREGESLSKTEEAVKELAHQKAQVMEIETQMVDNETGQRGYILTQKPEFLEPYDEALAVLPELRKSLADSMDDPEARRLFRAISEAIDARLAFAKETIELQRNGAHDASVALVQTGRGKALMDLVRGHCAALQAYLEKRIRYYEEMYAANVRRTEIASWSLVAVDLLFVSVLVLLLLRLRRAESMLMVCAWSKTVQYNGEWISFEQYLSRKYGISISHGMSPTEARKMMESASFDFEVTPPKSHDQG